MDEVARERASAAHARLDGINGQIVGLRVAQDKTRDALVHEIADTREGIYEAVGKLWDAHTEVVEAAAEVRGSFRLALKIAGAVAVAIMAMLGTTLAYLVTHQTTPANPTGRSHNATVVQGVGERLASAQRGAHERVGGR